MKIETVWGPEMATSEASAIWCHLGTKKSIFSGSSPSNGPCNGIAPSKGGGGMVRSVFTSTPPPPSIEIRVRPHITPPPPHLSGLSAILLPSGYFFSLCYYSLCCKMTGEGGGGVEWGQKKTTVKKVWASTNILHLQVLSTWL